MTHAHAALPEELHRLLVIRDLTSAARHALDLEPNADAVEITVKLDKHGLTLDVTNFASGRPFTGWGQ